MAARRDPGEGLTDFSELLHESGIDDTAWDSSGAATIDPAARRKRRRAGITTAIVLVALLALTGGYVGFALTASVGPPAADIGVPTVRAPAPAELALPTQGASAVRITGGEGYFTDGDELTGASGGDDPRPIASVTKLITALVVLDARPLDGPDDAGPTLTFSRADHALYDEYYVRNATIRPMRTGSTMSQRDALEMMLIVSASNYAEAVANWAYGSRWAFVRAANAWLERHGLTRTRVVEPSGIDPRNTSTPSDMLRLGELAMADATVAEIVGKDHLELGGLGGSNTNTLLGVDGVRGIKTGTLNASGSNLLFFADLRVGIAAPLQVMGVVLGGASRDTVNHQVRQLLASIRDGFHMVEVGEVGRQVGTYSTPWGASARVVLADDASIRTWSDTPITATVAATGLPTGQAGEKVGTVTWNAGNNSTTVDLVLDADIEPPDAWWRLTHPFELQPLSG